ncbi:hypothetical protein [Parathermosynechococcus lividus]
MMQFLRTVWLCSVLLGSIGVALPVVTPAALARRREAPKVVKVTAVTLESENIAGVWYHRLTGRLINETAQPARNIQIYYEIYAPNSNRIIDAGSTTLKSRVVNSQAEAEFLIIPNAAGRVKITLVEWLSGDRDYRSHPQMQEFP